jgi:hypothetical protein
LDPLRTAYDQHAFYFWAALAILWLVSAGVLLMTQRRTARIEQRFDAVFSDLDSENVSQRLVEYLSTVRQTAREVQRVKSEHDQIMAIMPTAIRHVGLVRFSPFHDTGGDQSFALALLDGRGDGVVITGLHSRADSRLYAKPIEASRSEYALTPEEREAMEAALGHRPAATGAGSG